MREEARHTAMVFQPTLHGAKVQYRMFKGADVWGPTMWFSKPDFNDGDLEDIANITLNAFSVVIEDYIDDTVIMGPSIAYDMRTSGGSVATSDIGTNAGESTGDPIPLHTAFVVTLYTGKRGRAHRGRNFWSGFTEVHVTNGLFSATLAADFMIGYSNLMTAASAAGWTFGVRSGQLDGELRDPAIITPITQVAYRNLIPGTQRRRTKRG
jgi:hypothetical protein